MCAALVKSVVGRLTWARISRGGVFACGLPPMLFILCDSQSLTLRPVVTHSRRLSALVQSAGCQREWGAAPREVSEGICKGGRAQGAATRGVHVWRFSDGLPDGRCESMRAAREYTHKA